MDADLSRRQLLTVGGIVALGARLGQPMISSNYLDRLPGTLGHGSATHSSTTSPWESTPAGEVFNVRDDRFRATGDGASDDTEALQAAIDAAALVGGGVVYMPSGMYKVTTQLTMGTRVHLRGDGASSVLDTHIGAASESVIKLDSLYDAQISHLTISGIAQEEKGILITGCRRVSVSHCRLLASQATEVNNALIKLDLRNDSCWIVHNYLEAPHLAILLQEGAGGSINDTIIRDNEINMVGPNFAANGTEAIKVDKRCMRTIVSGNLVRGSRLSGVTVEEGSIDTVVSDNIFYPADAAGIRIEDGQGLVPVDGLILANNIVKGGVTGIMFGQYTSAKNVLVHGNRCEGQSARAMFIWGSDILVQGNWCSGDIRVRGDRVAVIGNYLSNGSIDTETLASAYVSANVIRGGRIFLNRATDVHVAGNIVTDAPAADMASIFVGGSEPASTGIRIVGNICQNGVGAARHGIYLSEDVSDVLVSGNHANGSEGQVFVHESTAGVVNADQRPAYDLRNVNLARNYDANDATLDEVADVLGTLIADLKSKGLLS